MSTHGAWEQHWLQANFIQEPGWRVKKLKREGGPPPGSVNSSLSRGKNKEKSVSNVFKSKEGGAKKDS